MNQFTFDSINWLQGTFGNESRPFFDFFSFWGGPTGWLLVGALVFWLSGSRAGLRVGFSASIAGITNTLLKWSFALPRPYYLTDEVHARKASDGLGMPSGHAQGVTGRGPLSRTLSGDGGVLRSPPFSFCARVQPASTTVYIRRCRSLLAGDWGCW